MLRSGVPRKRATSAGRMACGSLFRSSCRWHASSTWCGGAGLRAAMSHRATPEVTRATRVVGDEPIRGIVRSLLFLAGGALSLIVGLALAYALDCWVLGHDWNGTQQGDEALDDGL